MRRFPPATLAALAALATLAALASPFAATTATAAKSPPPSFAALEAREDVAARHALEREAHMDRNVDLLLSLMGDDFVLVDGGQVQRPTRAETRARFDAYFKAVKFRKWDDLAPPSIRVSRDGTLASVLVRKEVVLVPADAADDAKPVRTVFAWMETWEKRDGRWMLVALCSTREATPEG
jgi:ketosteroid isomerase-like protein